MTVDEIAKATNQILRSRNYLVISAAVVRLRKKPSPAELPCKCLYSANRGMFQMLHTEYVQLRKAVHALRRAGVDDSKWEGRIKEVRNRLGVYWPCEACILKWNPTNRQR